MQLGQSYCQEVSESESTEDEDKIDNPALAGEEDKRNDFKDNDRADDFQNSRASNGSETIKISPKMGHKQHAFNKSDPIVNSVSYEQESVKNISQSRQAISSKGHSIT